MAYEPKTKQTDESVTAFLDAVPDERKRRDSYTILKMMEEVTGEEAKMWGSSIVGFGSYHYKYASGHEGDAAMSGFSPRKQSLTLYVMFGDEDFDDLRQKLGKHTVSKACLYIKKLDDVDQDVLREIIGRSYQRMKQLYP